MGAHSTLTVSKQAAIEALRKVISNDNIDDETISNLINALVYPRLYNVSLITDGKGSDDDYIIDLVEG